MKKVITMLCLLVGLAAFSQSNITSVLNETCNFSGGCPEFSLGCCVDQYLEDTNDDGTIGIDDCYYPGAYEYYVTEDIHFQRDKLILRGGVNIEFRNGASLITNGAEIIYTCGSTITFEGGGGIFASADEMNQTLSIDFFELTKKVPEGLPFDIIDMSGRIIQRGITDKKTKNLRSIDQSLLLRVKGYKAIKIPYPNK